VIGHLARVVPAVVLAASAAGCSGSAGESPAAPAPSAAPPSAAPAPSAASGPSAAPSPRASSPSPTPTLASAPPSPQGRAAGATSCSGGEDLGVTRLGEPFREAVAAVSAVLGAPDADPSDTVSCIEATTEVRWGEFVLAAEGDRLAGWSSRSATLQTPSGITVGTRLAELERLIGPSLARFPANPDNPPTFAVGGVDVRGSLSSAEADARVTSLFTSFCGGP
jgi:hypothetical protein